MRDFVSIRAFLSEQEIDELQAAVDERREARLRLLREAEKDASGSAPLAPEMEAFHEPLKLLRPDYGRS